MQITCGLYKNHYAELNTYKASNYKNKACGEINVNLNFEGKFPKKTRKTIIKHLINLLEKTDNKVIPDIKDDSYITLSDLKTKKGVHADHIISDFVLKMRGKNKKYRNQEGNLQIALPESNNEKHTNPPDIVNTYKQIKDIEQKNEKIKDPVIKEWTKAKKKFLKKEGLRDPVKKSNQKKFFKAFLLVIVLSLGGYYGFVKKTPNKVKHEIFNTINKENNKIIPAKIFKIIPKKSDSINKKSVKKIKLSDALINYMEKDYPNIKKIDKNKQNYYIARYIYFLEQNKTKTKAFEDSIKTIASLTPEKLNLKTKKLINDNYKLIIKEIARK